MSIESTAAPTPTPHKKDKILGLFTLEEASLGLGALATVGVAILGFMKLQDMNIIPRPQPVGLATSLAQPNGSRVTIGDELPVAAASTQQNPMHAHAQTRTLERDPLGPNINSVAMDTGGAEDNYVERKSRFDERINAGY